jgi:hypothetical protein
MKIYIQVLPFLTIFIFSYSINAQPILDWSKSYSGGSGFSDKVIAITVDNDCNTYVTGQSDSVGVGIDIVTIKYDENGNELWKNRWDGLNHLDDIPADIVVDDSENVYVCGKTKSQASGNDYIVLKYSPTGALMSPWPVFYNDVYNYDDEARSIDVNQTTGDVYVTGTINRLSTGQDVFTIRYSSNGLYLNSVFTDGFNDNAVAQKLRLDNNGNINVLLNTNSEITYVTQYTQHNLTLPNRIGFFGSMFRDMTSDIIFDASSNLHYGFDRALPDSDIAIHKHDAANDPLWSKILHRTSNSSDALKSICLDNVDDLYVAASTTNDNGDRDFWIIKLDHSTGDTIWTKVWDGSHFANDIPVTILYVSNPSGIVVTGNSVDGSGNTKMVLLKYDLDGNPQNIYTTSYDTSSLTSDIVIEATKDVYNNIYIGGYSGSFGMENFTSIKYKTNSYNIATLGINGDSLFVIQSGTSYQWYKGDTLLIGETSQGIIINTPSYGNGNYHCLVTWYCTEYFSDTISAIVGVKDIKSEDDLFSISHILDMHLIEIVCKRTLLDGDIKIYDLLGHVVYSESMVEMIQGLKKQIFFSSINGIYLLKISNRNMQCIKKFLITN